MDRIQEFEIVSCNSVDYVTKKGKSFQVIKHYTDLPVGACVIGYTRLKNPAKNDDHLILQRDNKKTLFGLTLSKSVNLNKCTAYVCVRNKSESSQDLYVGIMYERQNVIIAVSIIAITVVLCMLIVLTLKRGSNNNSVPIASEISDSQSNTEIATQSAQQFENTGYGSVVSGNLDDINSYDDFDNDTEYLTTDTEFVSDDVNVIDSNPDDNPVRSDLSLIKVDETSDESGNEFLDSDNNLNTLMDEENITSAEIGISSKVCTDKRCTENDKMINLKNENNQEISVHLECATAAFNDDITIASGSVVSYDIFDKMPNGLFDVKVIVTIGNNTTEGSFLLEVVK